MIVVIRPTNVANDVIRTEVDVVLFVYAKMAALFTMVLSSRIGLVGLVGLALWLGSGLALNKYRCERPDNDDVKRSVGRFTETLRGLPAV